MNETSGYAVFFFPPAIEALGEAIKPYLQDGPAGPHVPCREVDTGGALIKMELAERTPEGREVSVELMVPGSMVRMIVSARSDSEFGFYDRTPPVLAPAIPAVTAVPANSEPAVADPATTEAKPNAAS